MIQRIQTLYLALVAAIIALLFFMPVARITVAPELIYDFFTTKVMSSGEQPEFITWNKMSLALTVISWLVAIVCIFLYKKRYLQVRLTLVNIVLQLGLLVMTWLQINSRTNELEATSQFCLAFCFPLVCIILLWLASRAILKDIVLLKSYDRIR
ncbi:DUF4293 domain-containing protein [Odoribacter sp. OttesenSCG-928-J03]|nr:DUF4293 domain-containing protein [Odoribacter sp. OttesenSCG-928-J03]MDL2330705.1 DUF4293 domain-containing protein [Odoribacter sp. OttesenSCG-928-A06]